MRVFAAALLLAAALGDQCQAPTPQCIRGAGSDTIKVFTPADPASASLGACCAACLVAKGCAASQLVSYAGAAPSCWLMRVQSYKAPQSGVSCNSSLTGPPPPVPPPERFNRTGYEGVWLQHGDWTDPAMFNASFLVGCDLPIYWTDIEATEGVFDFSTMDAQFSAAAAAGLFIETALNLGSGYGGTKDKVNGVPAWIYNRSGGGSVPRVAVDSSQGKGTLYFPYYLDPNYKPLFLGAVKAFAAHIATYPPDIRSRIVASQAMYGSTGDDVPWHGTPKELKYNITDEQWQAFTGYNDTAAGLATEICGVYKAIHLPVLWNPGDNCAFCINTLAAACPGSFFKSGMESHGLFINYEADDLESIHGPICRAQGTHCRGEDWPFETQGNFISAPIWHQYAHVLEMLTFSLDMPGLSEPSLSIPGWAWIYELFNKYAGSVREPFDAWVGGIIGFRDGLDCANTERFPEATFGPAMITNRARFDAITAAFAHRGATLGDPAAAMCDSAICSRRAKAMNDVGWRVLESNFGNGAITQLRANTTSIGWWQVGEKTDAFGRYARGFEHASGKTEMAFVLEQRLWGGLPLAAPQHLELRVVYYDMFGGSFNVTYDAGRAGGGCRTVDHVAVGNSGSWRTVTLPLLATAGAFGRGCGRGGDADIALTSTSAADTILSTMEIYKV